VNNMTIEDDIVKCPECLSRNLQTDVSRGELSCLDCGLIILDNIIDTRPEWRVYSPEQGELAARTGAPMTELIHDRGLSTDIDWQNRDFSGKSINNSRLRSQLYRMRKWQKRSRISNSRERNLATALAELDRIGSRLELPKSIRENAARIYRKCIEANLIRGRSIEAVVAASIYLSCRSTGIPRTLDEVSASARCGRKEIGRVSRMVKRELKLRIDVPSADQYTSRFCSELGLGSGVESKTNEILKKCAEREIDCGRGPVGMCAASIYIAAIMLEQKGLSTRRTQREIADCAGVTEVTIRNRYKEIVNRLDINIGI
tara:strand:- start:23217 stop:24164 length:948 start_codon:yes stop_codon:yes gene_type:complete